MLWICYEYAMITWITLRWIEKCCHHEVFWCGIQSKINWSRSRALLSTTCIFFEQVLATSNFCSKKKKAQSRQLEAATSGYNLADADSYHVVPRISPSDDSSTFNDSLLALRTHKIHQPELVLQHGAFGFWTLHHFAADIGDVWRVHSVDAKTVKGVQDKCVMPPTLFHDRRWQALWLLNIVDLGCKRTCHDFSRLQMIDTIDTIDPQHPVAFSHWQFAWGAKLVRSQRLGNELWTVHSSDLGVFLVRCEFFRKYLWELSTWTSFSTCLSLSPARLGLIQASVTIQDFDETLFIIIREEVSLLQTAHFPWGPGTSLHGRSRIGLWRLAGAVGGGRRAQRQVWRETRAPFFFFLCFFPLPFPSFSCFLKLIFYLTLCFAQCC